MSYQDLLTPKTETQLEAEFWSASPPSIRGLRLRAFGLIYQLLKGSTALFSQVMAMGSLIASNMGDIRTARGAWLRLLGKGFYDKDAYTQTATSGTFNVAFSGVVASTSFANVATGVTYTGGGSAGAGTYAITVTAQTAGEIGNAPLSQLGSANPASYVVAAGQALDLTWISTQGASDESDSQYLQRCLDTVDLSSQGVGDMLASNIRLLTRNQVYRVWANLSTAVGSTGAIVTTNPVVYVSGLAGDISTDFDSLIYPYIQLFTGLSANNILQHSPVQNCTIIGSLLFARGTDSAYQVGVQRGLAQYINSLPIYNGSNPAYLYQISNQVISVLDTQNLVEAFPFLVQISGVVVDNMQLPIPQSIGSVLHADLSQMSVSQAAS